MLSKLGLLGWIRHWKKAFKALNYLTILMLFFVQACSLLGGKSDSDKEEEEYEEIVEADSDNSSDQAASEKNSEEENLEGTEVVGAEKADDKAKSHEGTQGASAAASESMEQAGSGRSKIAHYTVKQGDTLMWVAYQIYGDYSKWKDLLQLNKLKSSSQISTGMKLAYHPPKTKFNWQLEGEEYHIKNGDTLGIISNKVYGVMEKWKSIWKHNKAMIKNPNLIFAGFTLFYLNDKNG